MRRFWVSFLSVLSVVGTPYVAAFGAQTTFTPDSHSAKSYLEGLLVRRYSQELGTLLDRDAFSVSAGIDLIETTPLKTSIPTDELFNDLMLGSLDADRLLAAGPLTPQVEERSIAQRMIDNFRIRSVVISVGVKPEVSEVVRGEVDQWLKKRLASEFGKAGRGTVTVTKRIPEKKIPEPSPDVSPQTLLEWVHRYQSFAGQAVLAAAIVLGIILWQLLGKMFGTNTGVAASGGASVQASPGRSEEESDFASLADAAKELQAEQEATKRRDDEALEREIARSGRDVESLKARLRELAPRLQNYMEEIIRQWCMMGDTGRLRLACFAEAAGKETGKLPIPVDALSEVQKVFARMTEISYAEKRESLEKAYWDLLSTLNLGSESLSQPFSYIDGMNLGMVNRVLMDQNPRLKTLVSLYMSNDMRSRYLKSLNANAKMELLQQAAQMSEIRADELEALDRGLMGRINPTVGQEIVPLESSFVKIVDGLTLLEEITLLPEIRSEAIGVLKRTRPSLAFLHEWSDDHLRVLMIGITPDELISYARIRPDMKERMLAVASMMVREIASDELSKPDRMSVSDKERAMDFFMTRLRGLIVGNDIKLEDVFGPLPDNVVPMAAAGDEKNVA